MKKLILLIIICSLYIGQITGQVVVSDPSSLAQITELVKTGAEQTKKMEEQVSFLKEAKENVEIVSSYLKKASVVERSIKQSKSTIETLNKLTSGLSSFGNLDPAYISRLTSTLHNFYVNVNNNVNDIADLLVDGKLKVNDAERIDLINQKLDEIHLMEVKAVTAYQKAYSINNRLNVLK